MSTSRLHLVVALLVLVSSLVILGQPTEHSSTGHVGSDETYEFHPLSPPPSSSTPRPKSLGKGTWKAIKIWESGPSDPLASSSSSTSKRASAERVVSSASAPSINALPYFMLIALRALFTSI